MVLSKRLGRKRRCDATPDRFQDVCHFTIFAPHVKIASSNIEGFGCNPGSEAYQIKNDTPNVDACAV